jgi:predicted anti-sigma-YlaC factor YlaD
MKLSSETIRMMMNAVKSTRDEELDCGHCHDELDHFIEMKLSGKKASEALPLVQEHLDRCAPCREEYEVLLEALQVLSE